MTKDEFYSKQEQLFDSFSKRVIKNIAIDIYRTDAAIAKKEISLSDLSYKDEAKLYTSDTYTLDDTYGINLNISGCPIVVHDSVLGQALMSLPPKSRNVILLFYFADKNDPQISKMLNVTTATINNRRRKALTMLKEILEELQYEDE